MLETILSEVLVLLAQSHCSQTRVSNFSPVPTPRVMQIGLWKFLPSLQVLPFAGHTVYSLTYLGYLEFSQVGFIQDPVVAMAASYSYHLVWLKGTYSWPLPICGDLGVFL